MEKHGEELTIWQELPYDAFCTVAGTAERQRFDGNHVFITFDDMLRDKVTAHLITQAKSQMEAWLADPRELGRKPVNTLSFIDEDGIQCHIFRYKKSLLSKWWLGIVSDSGTFSEMREYHQETQVEDARHTLQLLKAIWKKTARESSKTQ